MKSWQLSLLVQYHFHEHLEEFQVWIKGQDAYVPIAKQTFYNLRTKCPQLKKLVLSACSLAYVTLEDMPASLKYLCFRRSEINPYQIFGGSPHFSAPNLTCLDVSGVSNFLTSSDLHIFTKLKSLRCLFMENVFRINDAGIESIIEILNHLEVLDVEGTDISNAGVHTILTHSPHLKELYVGHIDDVDDRAFQDYFDRLKKLRILCVTNTGITSKTTDKFANCDMKFSSNFELWCSQNVGDERSALLDFNACSHYLDHVCCS